MPTSLYEKAKELIVKAVPEIMEITFGCEVILGKKRIIVDSKFTPSGKKFIIADDYVRLYELSDFSIILGRKIGIADVLRAIEIKKGDQNIFVNSNGKFTIKLDYFAKETNSSWNLESDDLSLATPECLQFIISILEK